MSAAAATSPARQRRSAKMDKRREKLARRRKALKQRATQVFDEMTTSQGEWLLESQITEFLEKVLSIRSSQLQSDAVQLVVDTAHRNHIKKTPTTAIKEEEQGVPLAKDALINAVEKYGEYISKVEKIDEAFQKYDKEHDGFLSRDELLRLVRDYEMKTNRAKNGIVIRLMVEEEDMDWIIEQCDADDNGKIGHAEYLPAIAAWEELAQLKMEKKSSCCVIL